MLLKSWNVIWLTDETLVFFLACPLSDDLLLNHEVQVEQGAFQITRGPRQSYPLPEGVLRLSWGEFPLLSLDIWVKSLC